MRLTPNKFSLKQSSVFSHYRDSFLSPFHGSFCFFVAIRLQLTSCKNSYFVAAAPHWQKQKNSRFVFVTSSVWLCKQSRLLFAFVLFSVLLQFCIAVIWTTACTLSKTTNRIRCISSSYGFIASNFFGVVLCFDVYFCFVFYSVGVLF